MIEGTCLCGAVRWTLKDVPQSATACSCTACRRYGTLWAYGWEGDDITLSGETVPFIRGDSLSFNFCATCGNGWPTCCRRLRAVRAVAWSAS